MTSTLVSPNRSSGIVFIDSTVAQYPSLAAGVIPGTEVVILQADQDAIAQITATLSQRQHVPALHIVTHGASGVLHFGAGALHPANLSQYIPQIQQWRHALATGADLLLYGCRVASGVMGLALVQALGLLTGANVAAAAHPVGGKAQGGTWDLEVQLGAIATPLAFLPHVRANYPYILEPEPRLVKDITPPEINAFLFGLTDVNGTLYFNVTDSSGRSQLWKSNGTATDTIPVKDLGAAGTIPPRPRNTIAINDSFYFTLDGSEGIDLWRSDGTEAGTILLKDDIAFEPDYASIGNTLFFAANDGTTGQEFWKSDGTPAGTVLVEDIFPGSDSSFPREFINVNGVLYFSADNGSNGGELWRSDGTAAGTALVQDIQPGRNGSLAGGTGANSFTRIGNILYFFADDGSTGRELWRSDGTAAGTALVRNVIPDGPGGTAFSVNELVAVNNTLYFTVFQSGLTGGIALWRSDGTTSGTVLIREFARLADLREGTLANLTSVNNTLYFTILREGDPATNFVELWKSDGTTAGTVLVRSFPSGNVASDFTLTPVNGIVYFAIDDGINGSELWQSDGTPAGTVLVEDIRPGITSSFPRDLTNVNNTLYFTAFADSNRELWVIASNQAPSFTDNATLTAIAPDTPNPSGETIASLFAAQFSDPDASASLSGVAIVGNPADAAITGSWQYSTDGGTTWFDIATVGDDATALVLAATTRLRFLPVAGFTGTPAPLTLRALDNTYPGRFTDGATRQQVDSRQNGGSTAIAATSNTLNTSLTAGGEPEPEPGEPEPEPGRPIVLETAPTLTPDTDTGISNTDGITRDRQPQLTAPAPAGSRITIQAGSTVLGTTTADATGRWQFTPSTPLADGQYEITFTAADGSGMTSAPSPAFNLTIDTVAPTVAIADALPDLRETATSSVTLTFSDVITGLTLSDLELTRDGDRLPLTDATLTTTDSRTWILNNLAFITASDGRYQLTLPQTSVTDLAGNGLGADIRSTWRVGGTAAPPAPIVLTGGVQGLRRTGGDRDETLRGSYLSDILRGNSGSDRLLSGSGTALFGKDRLFGGDGDDFLKAGRGNDLLDGGRGNDRLQGDDQNDILWGGAGRDRLEGGRGDDVLVGGAGEDTLVGGRGSDVFTFRTLNDGVDLIQDFNTTVDLIDLRAIFVSPAFAGINRFSRFVQFVRLRQVGANTEISIDTDGNGAGTAFTQLATLQNTISSTITSRHFVIALA